MTARPSPADPTRTRFPGFDVLSQTKHWDPATAGVVMTRVGIPPNIRFFTVDEEATATALFDLLLDQQPDNRVPVVAMVDARLAEDETDGWRYQDMPADAQAWQRSLAGLDADARERHGTSFASASPEDRTNIVATVQDAGDSEWHAMKAGHVWSLWTRYACTAFYAHPSAWNEIGFPGPAYPRGYKNPGVDRREPFEVADAVPGADPVRGDG